MSITLERVRDIEPGKGRPRITILTILICIRKPVMWPQDIVYSQGSVDKDTNLCSMQRTPFPVELFKSHTGCGGLLSEQTVFLASTFCKVLSVWLNWLSGNIRKSGLDSKSPCIPKILYVTSNVFSPHSHHSNSHRFLSGALGSSLASHWGLRGA